MGAALDRIHILDGIQGPNDKRSDFTLQDIDVLREALAELRPALTVIDPIQGYMGSGVDMHRAIDATSKRLAQDALGIVAGHRVGRHADPIRIASLQSQRQRQSRRVGRVDDRRIGSVDAPDWI